MNDMEVGFNVEENITPILQRFTDKDWFGIERRAMRKGANYLKTEGRKTFRKKLPAASKQGSKYSDKLVDAIISTVYVQGSTTTSFKVHNAGTRKSESGTFRARFFEKGTKRKSGKQHIKPLNYMQETVPKMNQAMEKVESQLTTEINKALIKNNY